jgi:hypothetical protein
MRIGTNSTGSGDNKLNRHVVRIDSTVNYDAEEPSSKITRSVYLNIVEPEVIFSAAEVQILVDQLAAFATAENIIKLLNGES